jgi:hypothetical protein
LHPANRAAANSTWYLKTVPAYCSTRVNTR